MYPEDSGLSYDTKDTVYFFSNKYDPLNNWSAHQVKLWGKTFPTAEHAFHYRKYTETAPEIARKILKAPSPWAAMQIRRKYKKEVRQDWWGSVELGIMTEIIRAKVEQNEDVRQCLIATGSKKIIENSPWDEFWGNGPDKKGKNMLGVIMMEVREELKAKS